MSRSLIGYWAKIAAGPPLFVLLTAFVLNAFGGSVAAAAASSPTVTVLGDSLTKGLYASTAQADFANLVANHLGATLHATGVTGGTLANYSYNPVDFPQNSEWVVVELSTNDIRDSSTNPPPTPLNIFDDKYQTLIKNIRSQLPNVQLVCAGPWRASDETNSAGNTTKQFNAVIEKDCTAGGGKFVPLDPIFMAPGTHAPVGTPTFNGDADGWHPSDKGHKQIADAILNDLHPLPTPTPTPTPTPKPTPKATISPSPATTPTPSPTVSPSDLPTASDSPVPGFPRTGRI
jgi:acyl-CoA thioesterase I